MLLVIILVFVHIEYMYLEVINILDILKALSGV